MNKQLFSSMCWPCQNKYLRELDNKASAIGGRTYAETEKKRAPLYAEMRELQAIQDSQIKEWLKSC